MRLRFVFAAAVALAGCADILGIDDGIPREAGVVIDAAADVPVLPESGPKGACNLASPFGKPVALASLNTAAVEQHPRLSPDELTVTFQRVSATNDYDLYTASRGDAGAPFDTATAIAELDTAANEADLTISPDGLRAFFASDRFGGLGGYDIWQATRDAAAAPFGAIAPTANVSSTQSDSMSYYVPGTLWLVSDRGSGGFDIYRAAEQSGGFAAPLLVPELASPAADGFPVVSTDQLRIYFASTRGDAGAWQLYTATRAVATAPWDTPTLVTELEPFGNVLPAWISPDGCRLYFSDDSSGNYDMYMATKSP